MRLVVICALFEAEGLKQGQTCSASDIANEGSSVLRH